jgi:benzodiazapine receptor
VSVKPYRWWHGVAFYAGVQLASFGLKILTQRKFSSEKEDRKFYRSTRLPVFAPPPAAFPIAWTINSASTITGGLRVLNLPEGTPGKSEYLRAQAAAWVLYCSFQAAYFGLRSPINAALVTVLYTAATLESLRNAPDAQTRWLLATTLAWLALANPVGITQSLWNRDRFWGTKALLQPHQRWLKS